MRHLSAFFHFSFPGVGIVGVGHLLNGAFAETLEVSPGPDIMLKNVMLRNLKVGHAVVA